LEQGAGTRAHRFQLNVYRLPSMLLYPDPKWKALQGMAWLWHCAMKSSMRA